MNSKDNGIKTIELTDEQYSWLLWFKNYMTIKLREITNDEVMKIIEKKGKLPNSLYKKMDFDPEYKFGDCITDILESMMEEQKTGKVNFIT
jgi:hypothetical protein